MTGRLIDDPGDPDHGKYKCWWCRENARRMSSKAETVDMGGGCGSLRAGVTRELEKKEQKQQ